MTPTLDQLRTLIDRQAADLAVKGLLIGAIAQQVPNVGKLVSDFAEMAEDHAIRTMYSNMPEEFFQEFERLRNDWAGMLQAVVNAK
jgi:hypothetical protein